MSKIENTTPETAMRTLDDAELDLVSGGIWDDGGCTPHWTGHGLYLPQPMQPFGGASKPWPF